jgi:hypothetical protein
VSPSSSPSATASPSASSSLSVSPSPSLGYSVYTRGDEVILPISDNDLETVYTEIEENTVAKSDNTYVKQQGATQYMIHQFKRFVGDATLCTLYLEGKSTLATRSSIVNLQILNRSTGIWETLASNNTTNEDDNFELTDTITDLTNYKDGDRIISCRVYQLAI